MVTSKNRQKKLPYCLSVHHRNSAARVQQSLGHDEIWEARMNQNFVTVYFVLQFTWCGYKITGLNFFSVSLESWQQ